MAVALRCDRHACNLQSGHILRISSDLITGVCVFLIRRVKGRGELVVIMVERRGDQGAGKGPRGLELILCLNFDPAQGVSTATLLSLKLGFP